MGGREAVGVQLLRSCLRSQRTPRGERVPALYSPIVTDDDQHATPIVIQQMAITRWVGFGGGLLIAAAGAFIGISGGRYLGWPWAVFGGIFVVAGLVMGLRAPGVRVDLTSDAARVRGLFWTRSVRRSTITTITPWPFIKWHDDNGRHHSTPVTALNANGALPVFERHAAEGRKRLHDWAGVGGDYLATSQERS